MPVVSTEIDAPIGIQIWTRIIGIIIRVVVVGSRINSSLGTSTGTGIGAVDGI